MRPTQNSLLVGLGTAIVALLVGSLAGIAVIGGEDDLSSSPTTTAAPSPGDGTTTTTLPGVPEGPGPDGEATTTTAGGPATTAAGPGRATTTAGGPGTSAAGGPSAGLAPPRPGSYRFTTTVDGKEQTEPTVVKVEAAGTDGGVTRQRITQQTTAGNQTVTVVSDVDWGPAGAVVTRSVTHVFGGRMECDWNPDFVQYPPRFEVGTTWTVDTSCSGKIEGGRANGADFTLKRRSKRSVTGSRTETVGGRAVATWTVSVEETNESSVRAGVQSFDQAQTVRGTEQIAPDRGLTVSSDQRVTTEANGQKQESTAKSRLQSLDPT